LKTGWKILDRFFLLRPTLFYPIWTFFLAGFWGGNRFGNHNQFTQAECFWGVVIGLSLVMGAVFILNQIQDIETDRANRKLFLLANGIIPVTHAYTQSAIFIAGGLLLGFLVNFRFGLGFLFLLILSGWLYNFPPTRWKDHPIMGMAVNGMGGLMIYSMGWLVGGGGGLIPLRALAYGLAGVAVFLNTTLPDIEGDRKTGKITFGVHFGVKKTGQWALIFEGGSLIIGFLLRDWLLFFPALMVLPFFVWGGMSPTLAHILRATKFSVLALAIGVCFFFPWYLIPVFVVFFLSKWYYKKRFHFNYPSFRNS